MGWLRWNCKWEDGIADSSNVHNHSTINRAGIRFSLVPRPLPHFI